MNTRRKSGTFRRGGGEHTEPLDPKLAPGALVIVGADDVTRRSCAAAVRETLGVDPSPISSFALLEKLVHPGTTRPGGRPPIRGFLIEWSLGNHRDLGTPRLTSWLYDIYPRTPIVLYTTAPDFSVIQRECDTSSLTSVQLIEPPNGWAWRDAVIRESLLGAVVLCGVETPIFAQQNLGPDVLRYMNTQIFAPWVARRVHLRRWLLERADPTATVSESLLRTVEAYFETVPRDELARARGVTKPTMDSMVKEVARTWGTSLASLLQRWERDLRKRGVLPAGGLPWHSSE